MKLHLLAAFALLPALPSSAALWTSGHGDIGLEFDGTNLEPHFHLGEDEPAIVDGVSVIDQEFEIGEIMVRVLAPLQPGPAGGSMVHLLPRDESLASSLGNPFQGYAVEEISPGIFLNDIVNLSLVGVSGPGVFSVWDTDPFGGDTVVMSSAPGSGAPNNVDLSLDPGHFHFNVGFAAEGIYDVTYRAQGDLVGGGSTGTDFTVRYQVIPEPSSLLLVSLGALAVFRRKRR